MTTSVFGYPIELAEGWSDYSVYTFVFDEEGGGEAPSPSPVMLRGGAAPAPDFRSNVVVVREPLKDRDLAAFAFEQKQNLTSKGPSVKLLREAPLQIGEHTTHECEYALTLDRPLPSLKQWHVSVARDGSFFHFCCSATKKRFDAVKPKFESLLRSWA